MGKRNLAGIRINDITRNAVTDNFSFNSAWDHVGKEFVLYIVEKNKYIVKNCPYAL